MVVIHEKLVETWLSVGRINESSPILSDETDDLMRLRTVS